MRRGGAVAAATRLWASGAPLRSRIGPRGPGIASVMVRASLRVKIEPSPAVPPAAGVFGSDARSCAGATEAARIPDMKVAMGFLTERRGKN